MAKDKAKLPLQEAVLSLLCYNEKAGTHIAASVNHTFFDDVYGEFAQRVLKYRTKYGQPPGKGHIKDLVDRLSDGKDKFVRQRLLPRLQEDFNVDYVVSRVEDFVRRQVLKRAIVQASDRFENDNDEMLPEVEVILHDALRFRQQTMEAGMFLDDPRALAVIEEEDFIPLGVEVLDNQRIGLYAKELLLYIAPKGSGKTWFCCHCGRQTMLAHKNALHVTLEMSESKIVRRYYQTLFGVARKMEKISKARLVLDRNGYFTRFRMRKFEPKLAFSQRNIQRVIKGELRDWGTRLNKRLVVKQFATGALTLQTLTSYLDFLGEVHNFIPDVLLVDYPDLMQTDPRNYRISVGRNFEGLRGLAVDRNMALVAPTQGTRKTIDAEQVRSTDAAEDIRKVNAADTVMTFSCTKEEKRRGLGRLSVEHARDNQGGYMLLLSQSFATGQYVLDSVLMQPDLYWDQLRRVSGGRTAKEEER